MALGIGICICIKVCSKGKGRTRVKSSESVENVHWYLIDDLDQNSKHPHLKNGMTLNPLHLNTCGLKLSAYSAYSSYSIFNQCVCTMCFPVATWLRRKRIRYKIRQDI